MRLFRTGSLALRLTLSLLAVQLCAIVGWLLLLMTFSPYLSYEELAAGSARARIAADLRSGPAGWTLEPSQALRDYLRRRPSLRYAVIADGEIAVSSDPEFSRRLSPLVGLLGEGGEFSAADGAVLRAAVVRRPEGRVVIATDGDAFRAEDAPALFLVYLPQMLLMFAPALLAVVVISPWAVQRAMTGVRQAAAAAAAIDLNSIDRRLGEGGLPREVAPFVSAINRLLQRLEDGLRRRDLFMANAAHELRTPVAILSARIDALPGSHRGALQRDARRLAILVNQLLASARLRRRDEAAFSPVDMHALARSLLADMAPLAIREKRELELIADGPVLVNGDAEALRSALANLVDNALRAEPEAGVVSVRLRALHGRIRLQVIDHGAGVPDEFREAIFEPFWRSRPDGTGAGLGLAIVRAVASAHGGHAWAEPTPGGGATFNLELPIARPS